MTPIYMHAWFESDGVALCVYLSMWLVQSISQPQKQISNLHMQAFSKSPKSQ